MIVCAVDDLIFSVRISTTAAIPTAFASAGLGRPLPEVPLT